MRILFLSHRIPYPPDKGDKIRSFHQVQGLASRGHDVHVHAFADDPADLRHADTLRSVCASATVLPLRAARARVQAVRCLPGSRPLSLGYFACPTMRRNVRHAMERVRPDAVVAYSAVMAQYVPADAAARTIVDLVDVDSEKWRDYARSAGAPASWLYGTEWRRLREYEQSVARRFGGTVVSTARELALLVRNGDVHRNLRRAAPLAAERLHVVGNGVDLERYNPRALDAFASLPAAERPFLANGGARRLVFTGAMDYRPNVDGICFFVRDVLPLVRARFPRAELLIVGRNPAPAVRRLAGLDGVKVTGTVADVRPYLLSADAAIVPLRIARGIQNKALEAMASGCAVVATPEAVAGLPVEAGRDLLVGSSPGELAEAIAVVLRDAGTRRALQAAARAYVEAHHQWEPLLERFSRIVEETAVSSPA